MKHNQIRPTLQELAAAAGYDPWTCPQCGCKDLRSYQDWDVIYTYPLKNGNARRTRVVNCRNCNKKIRISTTEVPVPPGHVVKVVPKNQVDEG